MCFKQKYLKYVKYKKLNKKFNSETMKQFNLKAN